MSFKNNNDFFEIENSINKVIEEECHTPVFSNLSFKMSPVQFITKCAQCDEKEKKIAELQDRVNELSIELNEIKIKLLKKVTLHKIKATRNPLEYSNRELSMIDTKTINQLDTETIYFNIDWVGSHFYKIDGFDEQEVLCTKTEPFTPYLLEGCIIADNGYLYKYNKYIDRYILYIKNRKFQAWKQAVGHYKIKL